VGPLSQCYRGLGEGFGLSPRRVLTFPQTLGIFSGSEIPYYGNNPKRLPSGSFGLSDMVMPFVSKVSMLQLDSFLQRLDDEAQSPAWIEVVVDHGYYFWDPRKDYKWLLMKKVTPVHLVAPESKDVKRAHRVRKEKHAKAVFFKAAIAKHNKSIQRMHQSNE
jgi:hypothetical protein